MHFEDATALVTGASSGIGRATALRLAEDGAAVVNADLRRDPRHGDESTVEAIDAAGGEAAFVQTDVTDFEQLRAAVDAAAETFGGLDITVNNAGRAESYAIGETNAENWEASLRLNLTGVYHGCRASIEHMLAQDGGSIVNVASVFGLVGAPNSASYSAAKGGVVALSRQIARDYAAEGIRVNSVAPGFVDTPMFREDTHDGTEPYATRSTPMGRIGDPAEVADAIAYLCSDHASFVTGQNLAVDGGYAVTR